MSETSGEVAARQWLRVIEFVLLRLARLGEGSGRITIRMQGGILATPRVRLTTGAREGWWLAREPLDTTGENQRS